MRIISANVNGIRAAARRGGMEWMTQWRPDVVTLQEVRADEQQLGKVLGEAGMGDWHVAHAPSRQAGRSGVAILSRRTGFSDVRIGLSALPADSPGDSGRWIEVDLETSGGPVTLVSTYVPTGEADTARQDEKYRFLDAMHARMSHLLSRGPTLVTGDLNVAHREVDIKNWRGNLKKAGFLPAERAYLDRWTQDGGWVDAGRRFGGPGPGPYTWWSWRGKAFDNDAGWRIDYALATPDVATRLTSVSVGRAASYAQRWSDHAALVMDLG